MSSDDDDFISCYDSSFIKNSFQKHLRELKSQVKEDEKQIDCQAEPQDSAAVIAPSPSALPLQEEIPEVLNVISEANGVCVHEEVQLIDGDNEETQTGDEECAQIEIVKQRRYNTRRRGRLPIVEKKQQQAANKKTKHVPCTEKVVILDDEFDDSFLNINIPSRKVDVDVNYETTVKVMWKSVNVIRIPVRRLQKLEVLYDHLMKLENVAKEQIMLTFNGMPVLPTDTPDSLNLGVLDFIDGGIVSCALPSKTFQRCAAPKSGFVIKFQSNNKTAIELSGKPDEQMKVFMTRYSEQVEKPLDSLKFYFDGLQIMFSTTPTDLDIESGDVIDVEET